MQTLESNLHDINSITLERPPCIVMALKDGFNARLLKVEFPGFRQKKTRKRKASVNPD